MGECDCHCDCGGVNETLGTANGVTITNHTPFDPTVSPDNAAPATTDQPRIGTQQTPPNSPYWDIVADLMLILHYGKDAAVDSTPLLDIAALALEHELAERLLNEAEYADALAHYPTH